MAPREIPSHEWDAFFDVTSKLMLGCRTEITVLSPAFGSQPLGEWVALLGIAYDPKGDALDVTLAGLDHRVRSPLSIHVDHELAGVMTLQIIDHGGTRQIIRFHNPLALPQPTGS